MPPGVGYGKGRGKKKIGKVMGEFKRGTLRSGSASGPKVTNPAQAKAIALSESRRTGPKRRGKGGGTNLRRVRSS